MTSKLDQLKAMTLVVADTGDIEAIRRFAPEDATTNPSLLLKAAALPHYQDLIRAARDWAQARGGSSAEQLALAGAAEDANYTGTYTQELNVDELDVVRYDGTHLFVAPKRFFHCCFVLGNTPEPAGDPLPPERSVRIGPYFSNPTRATQSVPKLRTPNVTCPVSPLVGIRRRIYCYQPNRNPHKPPQPPALQTSLRTHSHTRRPNVQKIKN